MKQKKMLALTFSQLKQIYNQEIPEVVEIADKSSSVEEFKAGMLRFLEICRIENEAAEEAREQIRLLLDYDGQMSMNCLLDRICQYRRFGCFMSF